jgi:hypothetical protein
LPGVRLSEIDDIESVDEGDNGQDAAQQSVGVAFDAVDKLLRDIVLMLTLQNFFFVIKPQAK